MPRGAHAHEPRRRVADAAWFACVLELHALKPGNVGVHGDGHGMCVADFVASARCVREALALPGHSVGRRILSCVRATRAAVGCNTNLGIALLCAPLAQAALCAEPGEAYPAAVERVLAGLDRDDAEAVFEAIRLAGPGGLGRSERHDVHGPARADLREIMAAASHRDRIALQYEAGFRDVLARGAPLFESALDRYGSEPWAAARVYLEFLARFGDTHVARKHGPAVAESVRREAEALLGELRAAADPEALRPRLMAADAVWKARGINPGTSADLTVASLFASRLWHPREDEVSRLALPWRTSPRGEVGTAGARCSWG